MRTEAKFLSRGIDYLGDLGAKLRDLQGYRTLVHELIQNADDAEGATTMRFDVRADMLVVDNDGVFSDCRHVEDGECAWRADEVRGHRCDFHRFRLVASGDKRAEEGTTGAFGIGFIAVYQIADTPEVISNGRHWKVHEERQEELRIEVCGGCSSCRAKGLPGTRFILPWAKDPDSDLRKALKVAPIAAGSEWKMIHELEQALPVAMLFLKRLRTIEILRTTRLVRSFQRIDDGNALILSEGDPAKDRVWHLMHGDFSEAARRLSREHSGRIEAKRSSSVTLAVPAGELPAGLLCACLPTEQSEGLPFHINADFFTSTDRKRVIFAADYQAEWNREALKAAARALGDRIGQLPSVVGATRLWQLLSSLKEISEKAEKGTAERTLGHFWASVAPQLSENPVIHTSRGDWTTPKEACFLLQREEVAATDLLEDLGVRVVSESLRPFLNLLRSEPVGVPLIDVERLSGVLISHGLTQRIRPRDLPAPLRSTTRWEALWAEIATLLSRQQRTAKSREEDERRLRGVSLAPGRDGDIWPCEDIFAADDEAVLLFEDLRLGIPFVAENSAFSPLRDLCSNFTVASAFEALSRVDVQDLERLCQEGGTVLKDLFAWFENRRHLILADAELKARLVSLPIYPTAGRLRPLSELVLAGGDFTDPLGLADLVDLEALGGRREFLLDLGASTLDFSTYVTASLPRALADGGLALGKRRAAIRLLASHIGRLRDNEGAHRSLTGAQLVECTDGQFREARECHFDGNEVRSCLHPDAPIATLPKENEAAVRDLYAWLGVAAEPRLSAIVERVRELASEPYSPTIVGQIQRIVQHLAERARGGNDLPELAALKSAKWLPAAGNVDRFYAPGELYAVYQAHIFETQAFFLDVPRNIQNAGRALLDVLGVQISPPPALVVRHLIHCATQGDPVHSDVYRYLNENAEDPALSQLEGRRCLWLGESYRMPAEVFWGEHPFGRYRHRLSEQLRAYASLLKRLRVRETPTWEDALRVLNEVAVEFGSPKRPLDDETHAVVLACWRSIGRALEEGEASAEAVAKLHSVRCVPNPNHMLYRPDWMFFENRAGLAAKFGAFLAQNVTARPIGVGRALEQAGVRSLGTAVEVELLECTDPVDDHDMSSRLRSRRAELGRVVGIYDTADDQTAALKRLDGIRCQSAESIGIRYRLRAFNQERHSDMEHVPALYQPERERLVFSRKEVPTPWAAIARELAIALFPEEDPGRFAAGFKEALAPPSPEEAAKTLDELGYARLDTSVVELSSAPATAETLGVSTPVEDAIPAGLSSESPPSGDAGITPAEAVSQLLGGDTPSPTAPIDGVETEAYWGSRQPVGGKVPGFGKHRRPPVLRSYIPAPESGETEGHLSTEPGRSPVDEAGVRHVMDFELGAGRIPVEMPHNNPGYDIESRDSSGRTLRYIEVKSLSGLWTDTFATLSRLQFDKATELGDQFWLYVVERAEMDDFRIHRIQSPAHKANHFMFDDGWRVSAEPTPSPQEGA